MVASIGLLLEIHPPQYEQDFWQSELYRTDASCSDGWAFFVTVANNLLLLHNNQFYPWDAVNLAQVACFLTIVLALLQRLLQSVLPEIHWRWRLSIMCVIRLSSFLSILFTINASRIAQAAMQGSPTVSQNSSTPPAPPTAVTAAMLIDTCRVVLIASGALVSCIHGAAQQLPFKRHLLLQFVYLFACIAFISLPAARTVGCAGLDEAARHLCHCVATLAHLCKLSFVFSPQALEQCSPLCQTHASHLTIYFLQLFIGFAIPVYIAFQHERRLKHTFILHLTLASYAQALHSQPAREGSEPHHLHTPAQLNVAEGSTAAAPSPSGTATTGLRHRLTGSSQITAEGSNPGEGGAHGRQGGPQPTRHEQEDQQQLWWCWGQQQPGQLPPSFPDVKSLRKGRSWALRVVQDTLLLLLFAMLSCRYAVDFLPELLMISGVFDNGGQQQQVPVHGSSTGL